MVIRDFKVGALLVTDCADNLYCKLSDAPPGISGSVYLANVATGEISQTVDIRGCRVARPSDLRKAAEKYSDRLVFHPDDSPFKR
jgi:hypothetical protein